MPRIVIAGEDTEVDPNDPASVHAAQLWLQELCKPRGSADLEKYVDIVAELLVDPLLSPSLMRSAPVLTVRAVDVPADGGGAIGALQRTLKEAGLLGPLPPRPNNLSESRRDLMELRLTQLLRLSSNRAAHRLASAIYDVAEYPMDETADRLMDDKGEPNVRACDDVEEREVVHYVLCHLKHCFDGPAVNEFIKAVHQASGRR
ncbi:hypothetical protein MMC17_005332 [Xylographa soralifera]|nr:hypothetical protein [Xylographa soralifera]